jgi:ubiquitin-protein ligase E3 C
MFADEVNDKGAARRLAAKKNREKANAEKAKRDKFIAEENAKKQEAERAAAASMTPPASPDMDEGEVTKLPALAGASPTSQSASTANTTSINFQLPSSAPSTSATTTTTASSTSASSSSSSSSSSFSYNLPSPPLDPKASAADVARFHRKERDRARALGTAATKIQSIVRMLQSQASSRASKATIYDTRISLLLKVSQSMKSPSVYIPPPSVVSSLGVLFLYISDSMNCSSDSKRNNDRRNSDRRRSIDRPNINRLSILLKYVISPGLSDASLHPLMPWLSSSHGRLRLVRLVDACLRALCVVKGSAFPGNNVHDFLMAVLPRSNPDADATTLKSLILSKLHTDISIVSLLRGHVIATKTTPEGVLDVIIMSLTSEERKRAFVSDVLCLGALTLTEPQIAELNSMKITESIVKLYNSLQYNRYAASDRPPISTLLSSTTLAQDPTPSVLGLFNNVLKLVYGAPSDWDLYALSLLLSEIPLSILTSKTCTYWLKDGIESKAVVIPSAVGDMAKTIFNDGFTKRLCSDRFVSATEVESMLAVRTKQDEEHATAAAKVTARSIAEESSKIVRKASLTTSISSWASKLFTGFSSKSSSSSSSGRERKKSGAGMLVNTSDISRQIANGTASAPAAPATAAAADDDKKTSKRSVTLSSLVPMARLVAVLLTRYGGIGWYNILTNSAVACPNGSDVGKMMEPRLMSVLNYLCYVNNGVRTLWCHVVNNMHTVEEFIDRGSFSDFDVIITGAPHIDASNAVLCVVLAFSELFVNVLLLTDDTELHSEEKSPLPMHHVRRVIVLFKRLLYKAVNESSASDSTFTVALVASLRRCLNEVYNRSSRKPLCDGKLWLVPDYDKIEKSINQCRSFADAKRIVTSTFFKVMGFGVGVKARLKLFEMLVNFERREIQGVNEEGTLRPGLGVRIQRGRILEDGLITMNKLGRRMKERLMIQYVNEQGLNEAGIDVGGLFKDYWSDLTQLSFSANYALFVDTEEGMYPSPVSYAAHGAEHVTLFEFLGRILGKALFEGITIQPIFSHFFLSFIRGGYNYNNMLSDLATKDAELYKNLMFLKHYEGDAEDLCLTMSIMENDFGEGKVVNLVPNGENVDVTNANKLRYIHLVAKYHMSDRIKVQSEAFAKGLWEVIPRAYLHLFNEMELQVLISGVGGGVVDVDDMRRNCRYGGGFTGLDRNVSRFWECVASMNNDELKLLVKFVTSCERPPPLGFGSMNPPFTITRVGISSDNEKLPTASTCFNNLKLPTYSSAKVMKSKLMLAISSGSGFELS